MKTSVTPHNLLDPVLPAPARPWSVERPSICLASVALAGAGLVFTALLLTGAAWAAGLGKGDLVGALSWMAGLGLLALGFDGAGTRAAGHLAAGLALLACGWLASRVAPEFALLSALVLGASVAAALWRLRGSWSGRRLQGEVVQHQRVLAGGDRAEVA